MLACPRCGFALPYWRSRKWRLRLVTVGTAAGKRCPRCRTETMHRPAPRWVKPLQLLTLRRCSYRACQRCGWRGIAFHAARSAHRRRRGHRQGSENPA